MKPSGPIRVLIIDDERLARDRVRRLLRAEPDVRVVGECRDGAEAVDTITHELPDLVFLDVQMPGMDGFGVIESVTVTRMPLTVFVTAYDEYALRAFEVNAVDYLLKPFDASRFHAALDRARRALSSNTRTHEARLMALIEQLEQNRKELEDRGRATEPAGPRYLERLVVPAPQRVVFLKTAEIDWIETAGNYVRVHVGPASYLVRESLTRLAGQLDPARFARIHRRTVVNLDRVKEMQPWFSGDHVVILHTGAKLKLSRSYRHVIGR